MLNQDAGLAASARSSPSCTGMKKSKAVTNQQSKGGAWLMAL